MEGVMKNIDVLNEVKAELDRFSKKLALAINEQQDIDVCPSKHYAAAKRGALDLKNELTKLTKDSVYKWNTHREQLNKEGE